MPGRPDFSSPGTYGGGQTVATTNRPELVTVLVENTTSLAAGSSERTEVYAPSGSVYNPTAMYLLAKGDPDWTSGSHSFNVRPMDHFGTIRGQSDYNGQILFSRSYWVDGNSAKEPPDGGAQTQAVRALRATSSSPIVIVYNNNGDVAQDQKRVIRFVIEESEY